MLASLGLGDEQAPTGQAAPPPRCRNGEPERTVMRTATSAPPRATSSWSRTASARCCSCSAKVTLVLGDRPARESAPRSCALSMTLGTLHGQRRGSSGPDGRKRSDQLVHSPWRIAPGFAELVVRVAQQRFSTANRRCSPIWVPPLERAPACGRGAARRDAAAARPSSSSGI